MNGIVERLAVAGAPLHSLLTMIGSIAPADGPLARQ
jgi:hypothetical protein